MAIKIISETPVAMSELKEDLKKIKDRDKELNFRAQKTEEYLNMFVELKPEDVKEMKEKIEKLGIHRLKPEHITKLIDVMPQSVEEAKSVLSAYPITVSNENLKSIIDVITSYTKKEKKEAKKEKQEE